MSDNKRASAVATTVSPISIAAPAKLNLFLAITGRRADGFHDLVSVVAKLDFGDTLHAEPAEGFSLACSDPAVPCDESNLVLKAARAFAVATQWEGGARFFLEKRIPMGAGLGGGSSDAVAALRALATVSTRFVEPEKLATMAAQLGSDCPLFLAKGPVIMRGRGERVEALPEEAAGRLRGRRVIVFKPGFGISTPWAYARLAAGASSSAKATADQPGSYMPMAEAEARLAAWMADPAAPVETMMLNNMEAPAFAKFVALPVLLEQLRSEFGLAARMSGSGSACFAFLDDNHAIAPVVAAIRAAWGASAFVQEARLL